MGGESCETRTPEPVFDKQNGYLYLTDGDVRRRVFRVGDDGNIYVYWRTRREKKEVKISFADIVKQLIK